MRLSVITPSFNHCEFIERTIKSVLDQGIADLEYVIIDGGSTDGTLEVLSRYSAELRWVSEPDRGQADAVNKGLQITTGDIIGWINSDDIYYPSAARKVLDVFARYPNVDVVYGGADHIDTNDNPLESYPTEPWDFDRLREVCFICQPALFFRRDVITKFGLLDDRLHYCMDYEYWLRLGKKGAQFHYLPAKLAGSRLHPTTKTLSARWKVHREINCMQQRALGKVSDRWLLNYAHVYMEPIIDRKQYPRLFVIAIGLWSIIGAIKWNRGISQDMAQTIWKWISGARRR